jgi:hypothetical protein
MLHRTSGARYLFVLLMFALTACGAPATSTAPPTSQVTTSSVSPIAVASIEPTTATAEPPTATAVPPTNTAEPPTNTSEPPTVTPEPPTNTPEPPTATPEPIVVSDPVRVVAATIGLDEALTPVGLDKQRIPIVPDHDVGWYTLSARPSEGENIVLWGHVLRFRHTPNIPAPFARVKELAIGDRLTLYTADGEAHSYVVSEKVWVEPSQVEYILPKGRELLTLVSCIGDKVIAGGGVADMSHRLITIAVPEA